MLTMTPEERFERIERQLEFSAEILGQLSASQQRQDVEISQLAGAVSTLAHAVDEMGNRMEAGFNRMEAGFSRMEERQRQTDEQIRRTDEQMKRTDERLNALIAVVERRFSNGRH
jgi:methyl-accepting chemotaxis protein